MENKLKSSVLLRMTIVGLLTLLLLIPAAYVESLISERESRRDSAVTEVSDKWGKAQHLVGPVLTVPVEKVSIDEKGKRYVFTDQLHLLPDDVTIEAVVRPEIRYRGIYNTVVYGSTLDIKATFLADLNQEVATDARPKFEEAFVTMGIRDLKGVKQLSRFRWNQAELEFEPGVKTGGVVDAGISAKIPLSTGRNTYSFSVKLDLNGTSELLFVPVGKETRVSMSAPWGTPSFVGSFLPEERSVEKDHFTARWKVLSLNRNFPQRWLNNAHSVDGSAFGVKLMVPIDEYQKTTRAAKYAIMFIALSFLSFFLVEVLGNVQLHPVHYSLVGFALLLFYLFLLSLSEYISFDRSYAIAAVAVLGLVVGYAKAILKNILVALRLGALIAALYGFMYVILQMQDYALLFGSFGLFVILAAVMYLTRRINWFAIGKTPQTS